MKIKHFPKIRAIAADTAEEFETRMNDLLKRAHNPKYTINVSGGKFFAVVEYREEKLIPETLADEYELRGEVFYCRNCPECKDQYSGRTKRCLCKYAELGYTRKDDHACNWFYKKLAQGEIEPLD